MSLKKQQDMLATFSMASLTDVIFLLLVFFLVTSTFVFPTAMEVNLPEGTEQTAVKPATRVYIDADRKIFVSYGDAQAQAQAQPVDSAALMPLLQQIADQDTAATMALYADTEVPYGAVVNVLNQAAQARLRMVLATKAAPSSVKPTR